MVAEGAEVVGTGVDVEDGHEIPGVVFVEEMGEDLDADFG